MLTALFGECRVNIGFLWPAIPEDYAATPVGESLRQIREALRNARGHRDFIKSAVVPPCDYYMPAQRLIVEFDESQHFTRPRLISLSQYPDDLKYAFSLERWKDLCRQLDAMDDTPIDRDERRAWYDSLRDLVPVVRGFQPTIRLYAGDYPWCSLDVASVRDQATFHRLLRV